MTISYFVTEMFKRKGRIQGKSSELLSNKSEFFFCLGSMFERSLELIHFLSGVLFVMLKVQYDIDQSTATGTCAVLVVDGER